MPLYWTVSGRSGLFALFDQYLALLEKGNKSGQCFPEELRSVTKNPMEYWNWSPLHWCSVYCKRKGNKET